MHRRASVLVAVLWCVALLSLVVVGVLHTARLDLMVQKNYGDRLQAHYLALAGIEKAKALLYQDAADRKRAKVNHSGELYSSARDFKDITLGRGEFRVFRRGREDEGGGTIYGVGDEESRLNANTASQEALAKLYGMTPDVAAAIVDWRDSDSTVSPGGAEADYYLALQPPHMPRNGPFQTVRELLMVRGITRELLLGRDHYQNGFFDPAGDDSNNGQSLDAAGVLDAGWAGVLTVDSEASQLNAAGESRLDVQSADETALTGIPGITTDIARAIVAYRGRNRFESLANLLDVTPAQNGNQQAGPGRRNANNNPNGQNGGGGPSVISENLFYDIADLLTAGSDSGTAGAINVNTASLTVLTCLPGVNEALARAIINYRRSSGYFANVGYLLKVPGMTRDIFKQIAGLVTVRSETFRILSEGTVKSTGVRQRIQVIVRLGAGSLDTLSYREDL